MSIAKSVSGDQATTSQTGASKQDSREFEAIREQLHRQMLSAVSHDLKTPLATIIGSLEIYGRMGSKLTEEKCKTLINSALSEAYRLDNFITNILDMAKLEGGSIGLRPERCSVTHLIKDCITRLGPRGEKCTLTLKPEGNEYVQVDPMLLGRAIGLILDNAIKHGGKLPVILVTYGNELDGPGTFSIRIQDNGPGIPEGKEDAIFSKYTRFANTDQQNAGTGLGLAICRCLMTVLHGTVTCRNGKDKGAVFTLSLPSD